MIKIAIPMKQDFVIELLEETKQYTLTLRESNMKQWGLFLLTIGTFQIMTSSLYDAGFGMLITGLICCGIGIKMVWSKKKGK